MLPATALASLAGVRDWNRLCAGPWRRLRSAIISTLPTRLRASATLKSLGALGKAELTSTGFLRSSKDIDLPRSTCLP